MLNKYKPLAAWSRRPLKTYTITVATRCTRETIVQILSSSIIAISAIWTKLSDHATIDAVSTS